MLRLIAADHRNTRSHFSEVDVVAEMRNDLGSDDYNLYSDLKTEMIKSCS